METLDLYVEAREVIRKIINGRDISVRQLSNQIDIAEQSVSKMLSGTRTLTDTTLAKMAKALGISFEMAKYGDGLDDYLRKADSIHQSGHGNAVGSSNIRTSVGMGDNKDNDWRMRAMLLEMKVELLQMTAANFEEKRNRLINLIDSL